MGGVYGAGRGRKSKLRNIDCFVDAVKFQHYFTNHSPVRRAPEGWRRCGFTIGGRALGFDIKMKLAPQNFENRAGVRSNAQFTWAEFADIDSGKNHITQKQTHQKQLYEKHAEN